MFLKPSLSEVSIIYTLPFSRTVWISYALIVAILTVALVFSMRTEQRLQPSQLHHPVRWSDAALNSLGVVCQQGNKQVSVLSSPRARPLSRNISADAGHLCDRNALLRDKLKEAKYVCIVSEWGGVFS
jgi:hypothetical protein